MSQKYPGGFVTLTPPTQDPALGAATQGLWTLDQALNAEVTRSWPMYDPYYKNVVLNLHGEGTNGAQNNTFVDSSASPLTITRNGNTTQGSFSPYGQGWSNYFNGSSYLGLPTSQTPLALGSSDFTVEAWVYRASGTGTAVILGGQTDSATVAGSAYAFYISSSATCDLYIGGSSYYVASPNPPIGQWSHVAYVRTGGTFSTYLNGSLVATRTDLGTGSVNVGSTTYRGSIGGLSFGGSNLTGYISNLRLIKGSGGYNATSSTITVPAAPLSVTANTTLLTCQSNRLIDSSTNSFALTVSGSPSVQRFQPFLFNTSYTPSTIGGSGYFDGSGDYLSIAASSSFVASANFTLECWFYTPYISGYQAVASNYTNGTGSWIIEVQNTSNLRFYYNGVAGSILSSISVVPNTWTHFAAVRNGSTITIYINGVSGGTATYSGNFGDSSIPLLIGYLASPVYTYTGYVSNLRYVVGTAVYTTSFTPPTSPLTAISGTSLLANMTNAGIVDNAMMNDLETVGNAQISTSVKKYGTGSLSFDGTGDYLAIPDAAKLSFGTGNFTVEGWMYFNAVGSDMTLFTSTSNGDISIRIVSSQIRIGILGVSWDTASATQSFSTGTWYHFAVVRNSGVVTFYLNGSNIGSGANTTAYNVTTSATIGQAGGSANLNGYIDDMRITRGVARYIGNFTPPTSQLQDQ